MAFAIILLCSLYSPDETPVDKQHLSPVHLINIPIYTRHEETDNKPNVCVNTITPVHQGIAVTGSVQKLQERKVFKTKQDEKDLAL